MATNEMRSGYCYLCGERIRFDLLETDPASMLPRQADGSLSPMWWHQRCQDAVIAQRRAHDVMQDNLDNPREQERTYYIAQARSVLGWYLGAVRYDIDSIAEQYADWRLQRG